MTINVTVAICTWNRATLLDQTLAEMGKLMIPAGFDWELLVVNNNCTDETDSVIGRHDSQLPLRRVFVSEQGLSYARNAAIDAARGELILWADDDVLVDPGWLANYCEAARRWPDSGVFAGRVDPWYAVEPDPNIASLLKELKHGNYLGHDLGTEERLLRNDEFPMGANMAFRRSAIEHTRFEVALGRNGKHLLFGEEVAYVEALRKRGSSGVWVPSARLRHYVPASRVQTPYLAQFFRGLGLTMVRRGEVMDGKRWTGVPRWVLRAYVGHVAGKYLNMLLGSRQAYYHSLAYQWRFEGIIEGYRTTQSQ